MKTDPLRAAVDRLDPGSRALLDLSLRRGIADEEIAGLLRSDRGSVARRREDAIERVAAEVGLTSPAGVDQVRSALKELDADLARPRPPAEGARPRPEPAGAGPYRERPRAMRGLAPAGIGAILVAAAVAAIIIFGDSDGDPGGGTASERPARDTPERTAADEADRGGRGQPPGGDGGQAERRPAGRERTPPGAGAAVPLEPVSRAASGARATARRLGGPGARLELTVAGLPPPDGRYEVWLFNSVADAVSLGELPSNGTRLTVRLPRAAGDYRFLDLSLEPLDGNPNHSGQSLLRAPAAKLRPARP